MRISATGPRNSRRSGVVLVAVLIVVTVLSLAAYRFSDSMIAEYQAVESYTRATQARANADSAIAYAMAVLATYDASQSGPPFDNPGLFQNRLVKDNDVARFRARFSILSPLDPDTTSQGQAYRYGVVDETGKINLNALLKLDSSGQIAHDVLLKLPGMTEDLVNAILDWIDPDESPRQNGAENEYYSALDSPYLVKNGPLDSLDELLYVRGITPTILYGNDRNRNGQLDTDEDDGTGILDQGLSAYLTVYSRELNIDATNMPRIYVNDSDLSGLYDKLVPILGEDVSAFIIAVRQYGVTSSSSSGSSGGSAGGSGGSSTPAPAPAAPVATAGVITRSGIVSLTITVAPSTSSNNAQMATSKLSISNLNPQSQGSQRISSLFQLINAQVTVPSQQPNGRGTIYPSPLSDQSSIKQYLPIVLDKLTTQNVDEVPARVNINTAPSAVLGTLPNIDEVAIDAILNTRPPLNSTDPPDPIFQTPAWLVTEANIPAATVQSLERYITARPQVYRLQAVGHFDGPGPTARIEAIIDTNAGRPRIVYYRDLTELGKGFTLTSTGP